MFSRICSTNYNARSKYSAQPARWHTVATILWPAAASMAWCLWECQMEHCLVSIPSTHLSTNYFLFEKLKIYHKNTGYCWLAGCVIYLLSNTIIMTPRNWVFSYLISSVLYLLLFHWFFGRTNWKVDHLLSALLPLNKHG